MKNDRLSTLHYLLFTRYSLLATRYSLLSTLYSLLSTLYSQGLGRVLARQVAHDLLQQSSIATINCSVAMDEGAVKFWKAIGLAQVFNDIASKYTPYEYYYNYCY